jgi:anti-sigma B factor antagonist
MMLEIRQDESGRVFLSGRLDASQAERALSAFNEIEVSAEVDCTELEYISSAGIGVILATQKRLMGSGHRLRLVNVSKHIRDVFRYAGLHQVLDIE